MILTNDEFPGFLEEMDFVADQGQRRENGANTRDGVPNDARCARVGEAKPSEDQGDADPGKDDDLMDEFKGHGFKASLKRDP
jgi:hypothetical protein